MDEADVERIMRHPACVSVPTGRCSRYGRGCPIPGRYGTFPRILAYVREKEGQPLEKPSAR
jgi:hypothetical protein